MSDAIDHEIPDCDMPVVEHDATGAAVETEEATGAVSVVSFFR